MLRVTVERVIFTNTGQSAGVGRATINAAVTVGGVRTAIGNSAQVFDYRTTPDIQLGWSAQANIRRQNTAQFTLVCTDQAGTRLGNFTYRLTWPWREFEHEILSTDNIYVVWGTSLAAGAQRTRRPPWAVFARQHQGSVRYNTLLGRREFRMEICPVRPVPADARLPRRPRHIRAAGNVRRNGSASLVTATDPINVIPNPPIIPRLTAPPAAEVIAAATPAQLDAAAYANHRNAARLEYSFYWPDTERFSENDRRLTWRKTAGTGDIAFTKYNPTDPAGSENRGLRVMAYGTTDGPVTIGVHFNNTLVASYRAIVAPLKKIPCRFNILNGPRGPAGDRFRYTPISTPDHALSHREIATRFLRQTGVELAADTNATLNQPTGRTVTSTPHAGIFRIRVRRGDTRGVSDPRSERILAFNSRANVMNFMYIHSGTAATTGGWAVYWPNSKLGAAATVTDNGTPSSSWILPSGVSPDTAAGTITMKIIRGWPAPAAPSPRAGLNGMVITNAMGANPGSARGALSYGVAVAHEVGHMLNLGHRVEQITNAGLRAQWNAGTLRPAAGGQIAQLRQGQGNLGANDGLWCDELWHPRFQNVMRWLCVAHINQDFDLLQTQAVQQSPLLDFAP